jgi:FtsH-binding integral membrane protein
MEKKEEEFKEFEQQFINVAGNLQTSIDINMLGLLTKNLGQNYRPEELERLMEEVGEDKGSIFGAFQLYLDFINIFIRLLQLFGDLKDN